MGSNFEHVGFHQRKMARPDLAKYVAEEHAHERVDHLAKAGLINKTKIIPEHDELKCDDSLGSFSMIDGESVDWKAKAAPSVAPSHGVSQCSFVTAASIGSAYAETVGPAPVIVPANVMASFHTLFDSATSYQTGVAKCKDLWRRGDLSHLEAKPLDLGARGKLLKGEFSTSIPAMPHVMSVTHEVLELVEELAELYLEDKAPGAASFKDGRASQSCGENEIRFVAAFEGLMTGTFKSLELRTLASRERQAEHSTDSTHFTKLAYTGWDMLSMGVNVLVAKRDGKGMVLVPANKVEGKPEVVCPSLGWRGHLNSSERTCLSGGRTATAGDTSCRLVPTNSLEEIWFTDIGSFVFSTETCLAMNREHIQYCHSG